MKKHEVVRRVLVMLCDGELVVEFYHNNKMVKQLLNTKGLNINDWVRAFLKDGIVLSAS